MIPDSGKNGMSFFIVYGKNETWVPLLGVQDPKLLILGLPITHKSYNGNIDFVSA